MLGTSRLLGDETVTRQCSRVGCSDKVHRRGVCNRHYKQLMHTGLPEADDPRHGSAAGYHYGCKCGPCRAAHAERNRAQRNRRREGSTARRVKGATPIEGISSLPALSVEAKAEALGELDSGRDPERVAEHFGFPSAAALLFSAGRWRRKIATQGTSGWRAMPRSA